MISIIIATYGDDWIIHNRDFVNRAVASAEHQSNDHIDSEVIRSHDTTLARARNYGAQKAKGSRLVFLDADDWLDLDYVDLIVEAGDILEPQVRYWSEDMTSPQPAGYLPRYADLSNGNHIVIGAPIRREMFMDVGGFDDWPLCEDWALWLKMRKAGATFARTAGVYNVQQHTQSRNHGEIGTIYDDIRRAYGY